MQVRMETLRRELMTLDGVAAAEVDDGAAAEPSGVRVRLMPGADARAVGVQVQRVLASHGLRSRVSEGEIIAPLEGPEVDRAPSAAVGPARTADLRAVSVEETPDGVVVVVTAADGSRRSEPAEASEEGVARAVVSAVGALVDGRASRLVWLSRGDAGGDSVVSVLVERADGSRRVGAAIVRGGLAHAVARAVWEALASTSQGV
jgi:hypothetical protein